jgi:hypothetical protein
MSDIFNRFFNLLDAYKLTIISWIKDKNRLEIYGNEEWKRFFPDNYRGWLSDDQYIQKIKEPNIFILPNISATYLSAFGPMFDMIRFGKSFLHPRVMNGNMPTLEFSNEEELNDKLANIPEQSTDIFFMKSFYQNSILSAIEKILTNEPRQS